MRRPATHPVDTTARAMARVCLVALWVGAGAACAGESTPDAAAALRPGTALGAGVVLAGARTYPVEPMSPTSGRCALRLEHRASATWTEVFPMPGWRPPARFALGDVHLPDGRQGRTAPPALTPAFETARGALRRRLRHLTGDQLTALCTARDRQLRAPRRFWLPGALALLLLAAAALLWGRSSRASLAFALVGLCGLLCTAWPLIHGESFGSQEVQRLLSSLRPWSDLLTGRHGDSRHPGGLFVVYAPVARLAGTTFGLRVYGFVALAVAFGVWLATRWRTAPGEALVGLALLVHPILLKNSLEVGPYAFYTAGMLWLYLAVGGRTAVSRQRFAVGLAAQLLLSAVNHVATVLGAAMMILAVIRSRGGTSRREVAVRLVAVLAVALPFVLALAPGLGVESALRQAAERTPELAWGSRSFWLLAGGLFRSAFAGPLVVMALAGALLLGWRGRRTHWDGLVWVGLGLLTALALAALSPWLRVQPYYALYGVVPLLLGLGRLLGALELRAARMAFGLLCVGSMTLELVRLGPALARQQASPRPAVTAARAARAHAGRCPTLLAATNDLVLPLVPHLADLRRVGRARPAPRLGGTRDARAWRLRGAGLTLLSLYGRHQLPPNHLDQLLTRLSALSATACLQVLYDRRFPLPRLHRRLTRRCVTTADGGPYQLFACGPAR